MAGLNLRSGLIRDIIELRVELCCARGLDPTLLDPVPAQKALLRSYDRSQLLHIWSRLNYMVSSESRTN